MKERKELERERRVVRRTKGPGAEAMGQGSSPPGEIYVRPGRASRLAAQRQERGAAIQWDIPIDSRLVMKVQWLP